MTRPSTSAACKPNAQMLPPAMGHDSRALYELTKTLAGRKPARPAPTRLEDGATARTPIEARDRWRRHFADVYCSTTAAPIDLLTSTEPDPHTAVAPDAHFLPTLAEVVGASGQAKRRKAPGIDAIPPDALAALPNEFVPYPPAPTHDQVRADDERARPVEKGSVLTTFPKTLRRLANLRKLPRNHPGLRRRQELPPAHAKTAYAAPQPVCPPDAMRRHRRP